MIHAHYLLFIGREGRSADVAEDLLREFCARVHGQDAQVDVILVSRDPLMAEQFAVLATPMMVRVLPLPGQRIIGVPHDVEHLFEVFDVTLEPDLPGVPDAP